MNVRIVVLLALVVVLAGCMGWEPAQVPNEPIVDVKTDDDALGYDDRTPDLSGIDNSPPTAVSGVDQPTPEATDTPAPIYTPTPNATATPAATPNGTAATPAGTATTPNGTDTTPDGTETTPDGTTTPVTTATPDGTATDLPSGEDPTPASTDDE